MTRALVGLHGTDPATPYLSLWARLPGFTVTDLDAALYQDRHLIKHMAMRRTLWVVHTADLPAVQAAASDRVAATERKRLIGDVEKSGIAADGEAWLERAAAAVRGHLEAGLVAGTAALRAALQDPAVVTRMRDLGAEIVPESKLTPDGLRSWLKQETDRWGPVIKAAGVYAD